MIFFYLFLFVFSYFFFGANGATSYTEVTLNFFLTSAHRARVISRTQRIIFRSSSAYYFAL